MPNGDLSLDEALAYAERADDEFKEGVNQILATQNSPGFSILIAHMKAEAEQAKQELVEADPLDTKEIMRLQNTVKRFQWLAEAPSEIIRAHVAAEIADEAQAQEYDD